MTSPASGEVETGVSTTLRSGAQVYPLGSSGSERYMLNIVLFVLTNKYMTKLSEQQFEITNKRMQFQSRIIAEMSKTSPFAY